MNNNLYVNFNMYKPKKTYLYKIFKILSILIDIGLFFLVTYKMFSYGEIYGGNEGSASTIPIYIANQISVFVFPILISYVAFLIILIVEDTYYKQSYYGLAAFTIFTIIFNLCLIYIGFMTIFLLILFLPVIVPVITHFRDLGYKRDLETYKKIFFIY